MKVQSRFVQFFAIMFLFIFNSITHATGYFPVPLKENEHVVKMISGKKETYLISNYRVYRKCKDGFNVVINSPSVINDAIIDSNTLWIASDAGLFHTNLTDFKMEEEKGLVFKFKEHNVNRLALDASGTMWIGTFGSGVYTKKGRLFETKLEISPILSLATTPNGDVWVGTNVGMYRFRHNEKNWNRYAEEGYSGYELPDNIVENLFGDSQSNMWVLMPDIVSFVSVGNTDGHIPAYSYVGKPNNQVLDIVNLDKSSYLFATTDGLVYLPGAPEDKHDHGSSEVHTEEKGPGAILVSNDKLNSPASLANEKVIKLLSEKDKIWFITNKGIWSVKTKQFRSIVKNTPSKK